MRQKVKYAHTIISINNFSLLFHCIIIRLLQQQFNINRQLYSTLSHPPKLGEKLKFSFADFAPLPLPKQGLEDFEIL